MSFFLVNKIPLAWAINGKRNPLSLTINIIFIFWFRWADNCFPASSKFLNSGVLRDEAKNQAEFQAGIYCRQFGLTMQITAENHEFIPEHTSGDPDSPLRMISSSCPKEKKKKKNIWLHLKDDSDSQMLMKICFINVFLKKKKKGNSIDYLIFRA